MAVVENQEPEQKVFSLIREKEELQQMLEHMRAEKEQLRNDLQESIERVGLAPWPTYSPSWPCLFNPLCVGRDHMMPCSLSRIRRSHGSPDRYPAFHICQSSEVPSLVGLG